MSDKDDVPAADMPPPPRRPPPSAFVAVAAAAQAAARQGTPAQRERLAAEAAVRAMGEMSKDVERTDALSSRPTTSYESPKWGGIPGKLYGMMLIKDGVELDPLDLSSLPFYTFGRLPACDVVLDHPSISRLHAVIQYRHSDGAAFCYDPGSTHGVYLNKKRIPPQEFVRLRVGDGLRFGDSTRRYFFTGPEELSPEAATAQQRRAAERARDAERAAQEMRRARAGSEAWGSDSDEDAWADEEGRAKLDWRAEEAAGKFSDKQTALARKIKHLTARAEQLRSEAEKIRKKVDGMEDLTPGQASALLRCDQDADRAMEEAEEAEEALLESLNESGRTRGGGAKKRRRRPDDEDEDLGGESSDGDDLYDEAQRGLSGKRASKPGSSRPVAQKTVQAEDAASLHARRELLQDRALELEGEVSKEEAEVNNGAEEGNTFKTAPKDSLDAFMEDVTARAGADKLQTLKKELEGVRQNLAKMDDLIKLADPDGYFARSNRQASEALDRAKEALQEQEARRAAQQRAKEKEQLQKEEKEARKQAGGISVAAAEAASMPPPPSRVAAVLDLPPSSAPLPSRENVEERKKRVAEKLDALRQEEASLMSSGGGLELRQKKQAALPLQAQVAADLAALRQARGKEDVEEASAEDQQWVPPSSQKGDGRTSLNDRLGY